MRLEDIKKEYVLEYAKKVRGENKFDANNFADLIAELNGEREIEFEEVDYKFSFMDGYETEEKESFDYKLNEADKTEILVNIYKAISDERLKNEFLTTMLENTATLPYEATLYFERTKQELEVMEEKVEEETKEAEEEKLAAETTSERTETESFETEKKEEKLAEKKEEKLAAKKAEVDELKYDVDGPAITKYKADTEALKKELEELKNYKPGTETISKPEMEITEEMIRKPFGEIDVEIEGIDRSIAELNGRLSELDGKEALLQTVIDRIYNHSKIGTIKDDFENIVAAKEREKNAPQIEVNEEVLIFTEKMRDSFEELKNAIINNEPARKLPMELIVNIREEINRIHDKYLDNEFLRGFVYNAWYQIAEIAEIAKKPLAERDFNEALNKVNEASGIINSYHKQLHESNRVAKMKAKWEHSQEEPYESLAERNITHNDINETEAELLRQTVGMGYHHYSVEDINGLSAFQIEATVDRVLNSILAEPYGEEKLQELARSIKLRMEAIPREIDSINNALAEANNKKNELLSSREKIENIITKIINIKIEEVNPETLQQIANEINTLEVSESVKQSIIVIFEFKINTFNKVEKTTEVPEEIIKRIAELEGIIKAREGNTELYYECLKAIMELEIRLQQGLKFEGRRYNKALEEILIKMQPLPVELKEELNLYMARHRKYKKGHWKRRIKVTTTKILEWMKEHKWATLALGLGILAVGTYALIPECQMMVNSCLWHVLKALGASQATLDTLHNTNIGLNQVNPGYAFNASSGLYTEGGVLGAKELYTAAGAKLYTALLTIGTVTGIKGLVDAIKDKFNKKNPKVIETTTTSTEEEYVEEEEITEEKSVSKTETKIETKAGEFTPEQLTKIGELVNQKVEEALKTAQQKTIENLTKAGFSEEQIMAMLSGNPVPTPEEPELEGRTL